MKDKVTPKVNQYKATVSIEFTAPDRATALKRAREVFDGKDVKIRLQEGVLGWLTLPDAPAQS